MKKNIILAITLILISGFSISTSAHTRKFYTQLYWVVETNISQPDVSIVKFYNMENQLVREIKLEGFLIDTQKPAHQKMLNQMGKDIQNNSEVVTRKSKAKRSI